MCGSNVSCHCFYQKGSNQLDLLETIVSDLSHIFPENENPLIVRVIFFFQKSDICNIKDRLHSFLQSIPSQPPKEDKVHRISSTRRSFFQRRPIGKWEFPSLEWKSPALQMGMTFSLRNEMDISRKQQKK